jgi:hypothetical protein
MRVNNVAVRARAGRGARADSSRHVDCYRGNECID